MSDDSMALGYALGQDSNNNGGGNDGMWGGNGSWIFAFYVGDRTHGTEKMQGYARGGGAKLNRQMAEKWVRGMKNADGSTGEHWTMDEASEIMRRHGYNCNPVKFWVAINAVYSDLCDTAQRHGVDNEDFYADMAKSFWLCDKDAVEDKLAAYYENVVRHN